MSEIDRRLTFISDISQSLEDYSSDILSFKMKDRAACYAACDMASYALCDATDFGIVDTDIFATALSAMRESLRFTPDINLEIDTGNRDVFVEILGGPYKIRRRTSDLAGKQAYEAISRFDANEWAGRPDGESRLSMTKCYLSSCFHYALVTTAFALDNMRGKRSVSSPYYSGQSAVQYSCMISRWQESYEEQLFRANNLYRESVEKSIEIVILERDTCRNIIC